MIQTALEGYCPDNDHELNSKARIMEFLASNDNAFDRSNLAGHITGSGLLLDRNYEKVLLNHHKFLDKWLCFGGHSDGEANTFAVARRETIEESGIHNITAIGGIFDIDVHDIPANPDKAEPAHIHYDICFLFCCCGGDDDYHISAESNDLRWCSLDEAFALTQDDPRMQRMLIKLKNRSYVSS